LEAGLEQIWSQFHDSWQMILGQFRWVDVLDLILVWILVYRILLLVRKTGAMQILSGLGFLSIIYILSIRWEIFTFQWILDRFFSHLFLIVVILFQTEIRRTLAHIGSHPIFSGVSAIEESHIIEEIVKAVVTLSQKGYGALVVLEKEIAIDYHMEAGTKLDCIVTSAVIESIFHPVSPMHDGAIVIRNGRIYSSGCVLPLSKNPVLDKNLGTRHRAALGITEETDSFVLVVSEESKSLGVAQSGHLTLNVESNQVRKLIYEFFDLKYKGVN
jgi:diadenylate cyclase